MYNQMLQTEEIIVIIGLVVYFSLVIVHQIYRRKKGKSNCGFKGACSSSCRGCNIKDQIRQIKNDH